MGYFDTTIVKSYHHFTSIYLEVRQLLVEMQRR